LATLKCQCCI